jgi:hypothetical protein
VGVLLGALASVAAGAAQATVLELPLGRRLELALPGSVLASVAGVELVTAALLEPGGGRDFVLLTAGALAALALVDVAAKGGSPPPPSSPASSGPAELKLSSRGLELAGKPATIQEAVAAAVAAGKRAHLRVTGAAQVGQFQELTAALEAAGVTVTVERGTSQL